MPTAIVQLPDGRVVEVPVQGGPAQPEQAHGTGLAQQALQGVSLGFGDEITAGLVSAVAGTKEGLQGKGFNYRKIYDDVVGAERAQMAQFREDHPVQAGLANVGGALLTGGAVAKAAAPLVTAAPRAAQGAAAGAATGGVAGFGTGEGLGDRAAQAGEGTLYGLFGGALFDAAATTFAKLRPSAQKVLRDFAKRTNISPEKLHAELRKAGPGATLADVDDSLRALARGSVQQSNDFSALPRLRQRSSQAFGRVSSTLQKTVGAGKQRAQSLDELSSIRKTEATPLYQRVADEATDVTANPAVQRLIKNNPDLKKAWARVKERGQGNLALDEFADSLTDQVADPQALLRVRPEDLSSAMPSFAGMHQMQVQLQGKIGAAVRKGDNARVAELVRARKALLKIMDDASPDYKQARQIWAGTKRAEELIELGEDFIKAPLSRQKQILDSLDESDREIFSIGLGTSIEDRIARQVDTGDVTRILRNPQIRGQLSGVIGGRRKVAELARAVKNEQAKQQTLNAIEGGSKTAANQASGEILAGSQTPQAAGGWMETLERLVRRGVVKGPNGSKLSQMLLSDDPAVQQRAIEHIRRAGQISTRRGAGASIVGQAAGLQ